MLSHQRDGVGVDQQRHVDVDGLGQTCPRRVIDAATGADDPRLHPTGVLRTGMCQHDLRPPRHHRIGRTAGVAHHADAAAETGRTGAQDARAGIRHRTGDDTHHTAGVLVVGTARHRHQRGPPRPRSWTPPPVRPVRLDSRLQPDVDQVDQPRLPAPVGKHQTRLEYAERDGQVGLHAGPASTTSPVSGSMPLGRSTATIRPAPAAASRSAGARSARCPDPDDSVQHQVRPGHQRHGRIDLVCRRSDPPPTASTAAAPPGWIESDSATTSTFAPRRPRSAAA